MASWEESATVNRSSPMRNQSMDAVNFNLTSDIDDDHFPLSDDEFWTPEQLVLLNSFSPAVHVFFGIFLSFICLMGIGANALVLLTFIRFKRLRTPANTFIINLALSDFCAACFHPMAAYSSFHGRWAFGRQGCNVYGMGVGFFGILSILTFSAIACERCIVITTKPVGGGWKISRSRAIKVIGLLWIHSGALVSLPLFGISSYAPEGLFTSCSWDYTIKTTSNRVYYILLLVLGFILPVLLICVCYITILFSVISHSRDMAVLTMSSQKSAYRKLRRQTEIRTAQIIVMLILLYLLAWTPYAVITFIGQFGPEGILTPWVTVFPAYFAKSAIVMDPIVFGLSNPQFRSSLKQYLDNVTQNGADDSSFNQQNSSYQSRVLTIYPNRSNNTSDNRRCYIKCREEQRRLPIFRQTAQDGSVKNKPLLVTYHTNSVTNTKLRLEDRCHHDIVSTETVAKRYRVRSGEYNSEIC